MLSTFIIAAAVSLSTVLARAVVPIADSFPNAGSQFSIGLDPADDSNPPPPEPEPISLIELPLPPVALNDEPGSCTLELNPHGTGCINQTTNLQSGSFTLDSNHVTAVVEFVGAPAAPNPASIYTGLQLILIKADGTLFFNGDPWRCITCGMPAKNMVGQSQNLGYPQAFGDGKRVLAGDNIIDCGEFEISEECTPDRVHVYPIHWNVVANGSGPSGTMRELRIHPDGVHLAWSSFTATGQLCYLGRLEFNESPTTGLPLSSRYDLSNINLLFDIDRASTISVNGTEIQVNYDAITIGEVRGFSGTGREITYIGYPAESCNIDVFAIDLYTGTVRRLTSHPEYADPVDISPDDQWTVVMDTRGSGRQMFLAGMRNVPPIIDMITTAVTASTRNNGQRRFFQPWLIDRYGDRGTYFGQQVNGAGNGRPDSVNDPNWNGMADPKWSLDGTKIVYWQALVQPPACGESNPFPCPDSTAAGGRTSRIMLASLTSRESVSKQVIIEAPDVVPWATPFTPGNSDPEYPMLFAGNYSLYGRTCGYANVTIVPTSSGKGVATVAVTYYNFSSDGLSILNGYERVSAQQPSLAMNHVDWYSDLVQTVNGTRHATKKTSSDGFHLSINVMKNIFNANGTLTTTIDGIIYQQPQNGT